MVLEAGGKASGSLFGRHSGMRRPRLLVVFCPAASLQLVEDRRGGSVPFRGVLPIAMICGHGFHGCWQTRRQEMIKYLYALNEVYG